MIKITAKNIAAHFGKTERAIKKHAYQRGLSFKRMNDVVSILLYYHDKPKRIGVFKPKTHEKTSP